MWRSLQVHPSQRALALIERRIALGDASFETVVGELASAPSAREEAPVVFDPFQIDDVGTFELCLGEYHRTSSLTS
jgi:hypothetical protein